MNDRHVLLQLADEAGNILRGQNSLAGLRAFMKSLDHDMEAAIDAAAEKAFWEFDARRKDGGEERLAFKTAWREAFNAGGPS